MQLNTINLASGRFSDQAVKPNAPASEDRTAAIAQLERETVALIPKMSDEGVQRQAQCHNATVREAAEAELRRRGLHLAATDADPQRAELARTLSLESAARRMGKMGMADAFNRKAELITRDIAKRK